MYKDIDLTNPNLGLELLRDATGELPYDVWLKYVCEHGGERSPVLAWCVDPNDPEVAPIDPQRVVDEALELVGEVIGHLMSDSPAEALEAARKAIGILVNGSSDYQSKRGKPASMHHMAVRAYLIRKFNPHPKKPIDVSWGKLADKLFLNEGKCPRMIRVAKKTQLCGVTRHQYNSHCVKALRTAFNHLIAAMKHDGIPV